MDKLELRSRYWLVLVFAEPTPAGASVPGIAASTSPCGTDATYEMSLMKGDKKLKVGIV